MAASVTIPEDAKAGLSYLASLPDETANELLKALESVFPAIYGPDLPNKVSARVPTIPRKELSEIIRTLIALVAADIPVGIEIPEIVSAVIATLSKEPRRLSDDQLKVLRDRLTAVLTTDSFRIGGKARNILFENEHNLVGARIVSDIRPVFGDEVQNAPVGAIIVHSLKIEYLSGGRRHDFYVALDTKDVENLLAILERAKVKTASLKELVAATSVRYIEVE